MSREMTLIVLGIFVAVLPQFGIPSDAKTVLLTLVGLGIAAIGFLLRGETLSRGVEGSESRPKMQSSATPLEPRDRKEIGLE